MYYTLEDLCKYYKWPVMIVYQIIIAQVSSLFAIMLLPLICLLSCLLASPVFIRSHLTSLDTIVASNLPLHMPLPTHMQDRLEGILVCVEDWRWGEGKPLRKEHRIT